MVDMKIILILAICFLVLYITKRIIFNAFLKKRYILLIIAFVFIVIFLILRRDKSEIIPEEPYEKKKRIGTMVFNIARQIFNVLEFVLLFSMTTLIVYKLTYCFCFLLLGEKLLSTYITLTFTLIVTCYTSKYYGIIYKLLNYQKKIADNLETKSENQVQFDRAKKELAKEFSTQERYKNMFSEDRLKLISYTLAFASVFISKIEFFGTAPSLIDNKIWIDSTKVALESSVTFIAFDRIIGQVKKMKEKKENNT